MRECCAIIGASADSAYCTSLDTLYSPLYLLAATAAAVAIVVNATIVVNTATIAYAFAFASTSADSIRHSPPVCYITLCELGNKA